MGFRIVKINSRCKLETQLNYLVCRKEKETRILLDEIDLLIVENQQVCITNALISELMNHKVRIMFCDSKHNPQGEMVPYDSCYDSYSKIKKQVSWAKERNDDAWQIIVKQKITNQAHVLLHVKMQDAYSSLNQYCNDVQSGDSTNREGLAAKMYFASLFGNTFDRRKDSDIRNVYLNFGYSLILSLINREIASYGYLTQVGIHHIGETNPYNLGCDFMEPLRPFIDEMIVDGLLTEDNYKSMLMEVLGTSVSCDGKNMILENALRYYVLSLFSFLNGDIPILEIKNISFLS